MTEVRFEERVSEGIQREVRAAWDLGGAEAGGLLLGRREAGVVRVEDFEPVLCEHRYGPEYRLSPEDLRGLEESLEWFRGSASLEILGFYGSRTQPTDEHWAELGERYFAGPGWVLLWLKPGPSGALARTVEVAGEPERVLAAVPPAEPSAVVRAPAIPARPMLRPAMREPRAAAKKARGWRWAWPAAVAFLSVGGAVLGYRSAEPPAARPAERRGATPMILPEVDKPSPMAEPAGAPKVDGGEAAVRAAVERWAAALRGGDREQIARFYSPELRGASVSLRPSDDMVAHYGAPAILRITEMSIVPVAANRANVTFRKHWQTAGPRVAAGEEKERLGMVLADGTWRIDSETEVEVYWRQGAR